MPNRPINFYKTERSRGNVANYEHHVLSHDLEPIRKYSWEIVFDELPNVAGIGSPERLTLAAKTVNGIGVALDEIVIDRVNDKFFFPAKQTPDELVVVFDNQIKNNNLVNKYLYELYSSQYDNRTGEMTKGFYSGDGIPKFKITLYQLNGVMDPVNSASLLGVWMKSYKPGDFDYAASEPHLIECSFRWEFIDFKAPVNARFTDIA